MKQFTGGKEEIARVRAEAEAIFRAGLEAADPEELVKRSLVLEPPRPASSRGDLVVGVGQGATACVARYRLDDFDRVVVAGFGKASAAMARGLVSVLGEKRITRGVLVAKDRAEASPKPFSILYASHPTPDESSARAARELLALGELMDERTLAIVLASGGGSSLLCAPIEGISLEDKARTTRLLLGCGAPIQEMNCVRKHLSAVKGGRLAEAFAPATLLTLVLSDVVGDELDAIASGPTVPDPTTWAEALAIVRRRGIEGKLPSSVADALSQGAAGLLPETPKPGDAAFERTAAFVLGSNALSLAAAGHKARELGYEALELTSRLTGEAREAAQFLLGIAKDIRARSVPIAPPACLLCGGETTVTLRGQGKGGRNQELALAFLVAAARSPSDAECLYLLSASTDGGDGPTDAAGAFADSEAYRAAKRKGIDAEAMLERNDSYRYFETAYALFKTGHTGTNVCDLQILLIPRLHA